MITERPPWIMCATLNNFSSFVTYIKYNGSSYPFLFGLIRVDVDVINASIDMYTFIET